MQRKSELSPPTRKHPLPHQHPAVSVCNHLLLFQNNDAISIYLVWDKTEKKYIIFFPMLSVRPTVTISSKSIVIGVVLVVVAVIVIVVILVVIFIFIAR